MSTLSRGEIRDFLQVVYDDIHNGDAERGNITLQEFLDDPGPDSASHCFIRKEMDRLEAGHLEQEETRLREQVRQCPDDPLRCHIFHAAQKTMPGKGT